MKSPLFITAAIVIVLIFAVNLTTYQVDFTEKAVVATLGKVSDDTGVQDEPGLKLKAPAPLQTVTVYDRRARFIEVSNEQVSTTDGTLVANAFLTWRVGDPRVFYRRFNRGGVGADPVRQYETAEETLEQQLRSELSSVIGEYGLDDIFTTDGQGSALPELEARILERVQAVTREGDASQAAIDVQMVGISRLVFPESVSEQVITRMAEFRNSIGQRAREAGEAEAVAIRSRAQADRRRIVAFAEALAEQLRSQGDLEASRFYAVMDQNPELSEFLAHLDAWTEQGIGRTLTLVLPLSSFGGEFFDENFRERLIEQRDTRPGARAMQGRVDANADTRDDDDASDGSDAAR